MYIFRAPRGRWIFWVDSCQLGVVSTEDYSLTYRTLQPVCALLHMCVCVFPFFTAPPVFSSSFFLRCSLSLSLPFSLSLSLVSPFSFSPHKASAPSCSAAAESSNFLTNAGNFRIFRSRYLHHDGSPMVALDDRVPVDGS